MKAITDLGREYLSDGVTLIKGCIDPALIKQTSTKYDFLNATLTSQETPREQPRIAFWLHVKGNTVTRFCGYDQYPEAWALMVENVAPIIRQHFTNDDGTTLRLQLLETIVFNKPPQVGALLQWHQDASYYPLKPNNQIAVWIPFEPVTAESGAMVYAKKTHLGELRATVDLYSNEPFANETRALIPIDPASEGYELRTMVMNQHDMILHDGYVWHYSGPNTTKDTQRRGLSLRFLVEQAVFAPRPEGPNEMQAFDAQSDLKPGDIFQANAFPII